MFCTPLKYFSLHEGYLNYMDKDLAVDTQTLYLPESCLRKYILPYRQLTPCVNSNILTLSFYFSSFETHYYDTK